MDNAMLQIMSGQKHIIQFLDTFFLFQQFSPLPVPLHILLHVPLD